MKSVILAGGLGTRLSEETYLKPKPMIEIGGMPILWHIMKIYSAHGINEFVILCGYKSFMIKHFFANYFLYSSDITLDINENKMEIHKHCSEKWKVTLVDTGENSGTGGRLKLAKEYLKDKTFCFTYGDIVTDLNISKLIAFHENEKSIVTITGVQPPGRYGYMNIAENKVSKFMEKPTNDGGWINGGFFVVEPEAIDLIKDDSSYWEIEPLNKLAATNQLSVFKHSGFWRAMDTLRDKNSLNKIWESGNAPWKVW